jgi:hypothetical protein
MGISFLSLWHLAINVINLWKYIRFIASNLRKPGKKTINWKKAKRSYWKQ